MNKEFVIFVVFLYLTVYYGLVFLGRLANKLSITWLTIALLSTGLVGIITRLIGMW